MGDKPSKNVLNRLDISSLVTIFLYYSTANGSSWYIAVIGASKRFLEISVVSGLLPERYFTQSAGKAAAQGYFQK